MADQPTKDFSTMDVHQVIAELGLNETMQTADVLVVVGLIGKYLQQVNKADRGRISGRMVSLAESSQLTPEQRMIVLGLLASWNHFDPTFWKA